MSSTKIIQQGYDHDSFATNADFYLRLERIDLLLQLFMWRQGIDAADESFWGYILPREEVEHRLQNPLGYPHWMELSFNPIDSEVTEAISMRMGILVRNLHLTVCELDLLIAGLLTRLSPHYSECYDWLEPANSTGQLTRGLWLRIFANDPSPSSTIQMALAPTGRLSISELLLKERREGQDDHVLATHPSIWRYLAGEQKCIEESTIAVREIRADSADWCAPGMQTQVLALWRSADAAMFPVLVVEGRTADGRDLAIAKAMEQITVLTHYVHVPSLLSLTPRQIESQIVDIVRDAVIYGSCLVFEVGTQSSDNQPILFLLNQLIKLVPLRVAILLDKSEGLSALQDATCAYIAMVEPSTEEKYQLIKHTFESATICPSDLRSLCSQYATHTVRPNILLKEADCYRRIRHEADHLRTDDVRMALKKRFHKKFGNLAQRIIPKRTFADLQLEPEVSDQLKDFVVAIEQTSIKNLRDGSRTGRQPAISALLYGESGTGKTMAAEALAHRLSTDLIRIDLSNIFNKYVGETEKNLARIFDLAEADSGVLFFDEADALFGKRSEAKDARDRHANIEVSYLLQRLEDYSGVVVLATNHRSNLDSAFSRRFNFIIRFTCPGAKLRRKIWKTCYDEITGHCEQIDFDHLAESNELTAANICNIVQLAFLFAMDEECTVEMRHIERALQRELAKYGRLSF